MFTGLVESVGALLSLEKRGEQARLVIEAPFSQEVALGDSIALNGCCLTVVESGDSTIAFDVLRQTLEVTALGQLAPGSVVNLERALAIGDRLGGHFVQGHVDATGEILDLSPHGQDHRYEVALPPSVWKYCLAKGSLCLDGISLTIADLSAHSAIFWITPHTYAQTNLSQAQRGQLVNLEADLLAKYVEKLATPVTPLS